MLTVAAARSQGRRESPPIDQDRPAASRAACQNHEYLVGCSHPRGSRATASLSWFKLEVAVVGNARTPCLVPIAHDPDADQLGNGCVRFAIAKVIPEVNL